MSRIALVAMYDEHCLGIRYISAFLRSHGHHTHVFVLGSFQSLDHTHGLHDQGGYCYEPTALEPRTIEQLVESVCSYNPDLIGISLTSGFLGLAERLTEALRARLARPVAWGGIEPTVNPETAIACADYICVGEGEQSTLELVESLAQGGAGADIPGIWRRRGTVVYSMPPRPYACDLDAFPFPDFDPCHMTVVDNDGMLAGVYPDHSRLKHNLMIISQRGCPFACTFCCNHAVRETVGRRNYLRRRSPENVVAEMQERLRLCPTLSMVDIEDDVFTLDPAWIQRFSRLYRERIGLPFACYTSPGACSRAALTPLRQAGLTWVTMGLQSGSQSLLEETYGRRTSRKAILATANLIHALGITLVVDIISNHALETDQDRQETLEVLLALPTPYVLHPINTLAFYHGYRITEIAREREVELTLLPGTHRYRTRGPADFDRWAALFHLCQFEEMPRDVILSLARDPYWTGEPRQLLRLTEAFRELGNHAGNLYLRKSQRVGQLESELATLHGSRLVGAALFLRARVQRVRRAWNAWTHPREAEIPETRPGAKPLPVEGRTASLLK